MNLNQNNLLEKFKQEGLTPNQAMFVSNERKRLLSESFCSHADLKEDSFFKDALDIKQKLAELIVRVNSKESLNRYLNQRFELLGLHLEHHQKIEKIIEISEHPAYRVINQWTMPEWADIMTKFGSQYLEQIEQNQFSWEDVEKKWNDDEKMNSKIEVLPEDKNQALRLGVKGIKEAFQNWVEQTGLASLNWYGFKIEEDPERACALLRNMQKGQAQLNEHLNMDKDYPLMGLNGKLSISLGCDLETDGYCTGLRQGHSHIQLDAKNNWFESINHEWFHALDHQLGQSWLPYLTHKTPEQNMASQLLDTEMENAPSWMIEMREHFVEMLEVIKGNSNFDSSHPREKWEKTWTDLKEEAVKRLARPYIHESNIEECLALDEKIWESNQTEIVKSITENFKMMHIEKAESEAQRVYAEITTLKKSNVSTLPPSQMFLEHLKNVENQTIENQKSMFDYYSKRSEQLAYSFENSFQENSLFSFPTQEIQKPLLYASGYEKEIQTKAWKKFSASLKQTLEKTWNIAQHSANQHHTAQEIKPQLKWDKVDLSDRLALQREQNKKVEKMDSVSSLGISNHSKMP